MSRKRSFVKTISIVLSLLILLTVLPLGVSAADTVTVTPEAETRDVTIEDVIAGAASIDDLPYEYETPKLGEAMPWLDLTSADESTEPQGDYSLNTTVTDNGDGTHTMTLYDHPVKYVDEKGDVQDISLEIASAADGSYKTKANDIQTVFPKKISDGITLSGNGVSVKLTPAAKDTLKDSSAVNSLRMTENISSQQNNGHSERSVSEVEESYSQGSTSVIGEIIADSTVTRLDSETVSYYYDNRTTLEYSLTYTGFKEDIVVSEYTGQTEYHFLLETGGLTLTKIDESYYLTDAEGTVKATLGDIIIFTADERNNALGSMTHTTVREDQQYIVTIHIDAEYLKDEKTKYPIRIDPTIEITYDNNGASAIQDVTLNQNSGSSGTSGSLYVGKRNTYGISRTLMKFPGLNLNSIPSNCTIDSAYIEIRDLMCETTAMTVNAAMFMGNDWNESTANWSNTNPNLYTPISGGSVSVSYSNGTTVSPNHRYSINITKAVRLWKSGLYPHAKGIILKADDSVENGSSALYKTFASYNRASNKPSLKINYTSNVTHTAYGWLGFVNSSVINGWVWCSNHPSETLDVVLTITKTGTNQSWRTVGPASIYRSDVQEAGYGTGNYGFSCSMGNWASFTPGDYSVSAEAVLPNGSKYTLHASPKTYIVASYTQPVSTGTYYLNNGFSGKYLGVTSNSLLQENGLLITLGQGYRWMLTKYSGGYTIQSMSGSGNYLGVHLLSGKYYLHMETVTGEVPTECIWDIIVCEDIEGGAIIRNRYTGQYMKDNFCIDESIGEQGSVVALQHTWRIVSTELYGNGSGYQYGEITQENVSFHRVDMLTKCEGSQITIGDCTEDFLMVTHHDNPLWSSPSDFSYTLSNYTYEDELGYVTELISVSSDADKWIITPTKWGEAHETLCEISGQEYVGVSVSITHKVSLCTWSFQIRIYNADDLQYLGILSQWYVADCNIIGKCATDAIVFKKSDYCTDAAKFDASVEHAVSQWTEALENRWVVTETPTPNNANIVIYGGSKDSLRTVAQANGDYYDSVFDSSSGYTCWNLDVQGYYIYNGKNKLFAVCTPATIYCFTDELSSDLCKTVITHELGHALGYAGHAPYSSAIMYTFGGEGAPISLSDSEKAYIRQVYPLQ